MTDAQWVAQASILRQHDEEKMRHLTALMESAQKALEATMASVLGLYLLRNKEDVNGVKSYVPGVLAFGNHHLMKLHKEAIESWMSPASAEASEAFEAFSSTLHEVAKGDKPADALGALAHLADPRTSGPSEPGPGFFESEAYQEALARIGATPMEPSDEDAPVVTPSADEAPSILPWTWEDGTDG